MLKSPNSARQTAAPSMARVTQALMVVAGLTLVVGVGLLLMMNAQIGALQKNARDKEAKVGSNEQIANRYEATMAAYNATKARAQFLETSVSAQSYVPTLLQQLQGLAAQTHLTVDAVRPGAITAPVVVKPAASGDNASAASSDTPTKTAPRPPYDTLGIDVDVTGSYAHTVAFLYGLTRFPKIISVDAAQITPGPVSPSAGGASSAMLTTKLHLTAFVFHDSQAPAGAAVPAALPAKGAGQAFLPSSHLVGAAAGHAAGSAAGATKAAAAHGGPAAQIM
jgi:Tfp pilus assembly protein PilO